MNTLIKKMPFNKINKKVADRDILQAMHTMTEDKEKMDKRIKFLWGKLRVFVRSQGAVSFMQKKADESADKDQ